MVAIDTLDDCDLSTPRRVMRYVLVWCQKGHITLQIDGKNFDLGKNEIITITSGQVHFIVNKSNAGGFVLSFTYDFFCKDDNDIELVFENGLFCHFDDNEKLSLGDAGPIEDHLRKIYEELREKPYQYLVSIHARIKLILIEINRAKVTQGHEVWKPDALFLKFLELVRANYHLNQPLEALAGQLHTTEQKLNEQAKLHTGKTAQMVISGLIASEAKRLLIYESLSVKEIAHRLGFKDPFYFSNYFKKQTGYSPSAFREMIR